MKKSAILAIASLAASLVSAPDVAAQPSCGDLMFESHSVCNLPSPGELRMPEGQLSFPAASVAIGSQASSGSSWSDYGQSLFLAWMSSQDRAFEQRGFVNMDGVLDSNPPVMDVRWSGISDVDRFAVETMARVCGVRVMFSDAQFTRAEFQAVKDRVTAEVARWESRGLWLAGVNVDGHGDDVVALIDLSTRPAATAAVIAQAEQVLAAVAEVPVRFRYDLIAPPRIYP